MNSLGDSGRLRESLMRCAEDVADYLVFPLYYIGVDKRWLKAVEGAFWWTEYHDKPKGTPRNGRIYVIANPDARSFKFIEGLEAGIGVLLLHEKTYRYTKAERKSLSGRYCVSLIDPDRTTLERHISMLLILGDCAYEGVDGPVLSVNRDYREGMSSLLSVVTARQSAVIVTDTVNVVGMTSVVTRLIRDAFGLQIIENQQSIPRKLDFDAPIVVLHPDEVRVQKLLQKAANQDLENNPVIVLITKESEIADCFSELSQEMFKHDPLVLEPPTLFKNKGAYSRNDDRLLYAYAGYIHQTNNELQAKLPESGDISKIYKLIGESGNELIEKIAERAHSKGNGHSFGDQMDGIIKQHMRTDVLDVLDGMYLCVYNALYARVGRVSAAAKAAGMTKAGFLRKTAKVQQRESANILVGGMGRFMRDRSIEPDE